MKETFGPAGSLDWEFATPNKKETYINILAEKLPTGYQNKFKLERDGLFADLEKAKTFSSLFPLASSIGDFNSQIQERDKLLKEGIPASEIWEFCSDRNESFTPQYDSPLSVPALVNTDIDYEQVDPAMPSDVLAMNEARCLPVVIQGLWCDIGFDTEYISTDRLLDSGYSTTSSLSADKHHVLSYQYYATFYYKSRELGTINDVLILKDDISVDLNTGEGPRITLGDLIHIILDEANKQGFKDVWQPWIKTWGGAIDHFDYEVNFQPIPHNINLIAHFSRADLSSLKDFHVKMSPKGTPTSGWSNKLSHIRKNQVSVDAFALYPDGLESTWVNEKIYVKIRDTKNLAPGTKGSLAELGKMLKLPKLDLQEIIPPEILQKDFPSGRAIEAMDILLQKHPALFALYSLRDAEVVNLYCKELRDNLKKAEMFFKSNKPNELPVTLSGLGPQYAEKRLWSGVTQKELERRGSIKTSITTEEWQSIQEIYPESSHIGNDKAKMRNSVYAFPLDTFLCKDNATKLTKGYGKKQATEYALTKWGPRRAEIESFLTNGYYGGRNEQFFYGVTNPSDKDSLWYDYDLAGAYTTAIMGIGCWQWDKVKEWADGVDSEVIEKTFLDFHNGYGVARVEFQFPEGTKYPCIPYRKHSSTLTPKSTDLLSTIIFPLEALGDDYVYATNVEIALAKQMGATVRYQKAVYVPMDTRYRPYGKFIQLIGEKRAYHKQAGETFLNTLWKEVGNSLYGQTARGIRPRKEGYDLETHTRSERYLPASKVSCSVTAGYTTAIVRAVLGDLMWKIDTFDPNSNHLISNVTTDGFLTDFQTSEEGWQKIWNSSDLLKHFYYCRSLIDGKDGKLDQHVSLDEEDKISSVLKIKHKSVQHIGFRTRGQFSIINSFSDDTQDNFSEYDNNFEQFPKRAVDGSIRVDTIQDLEKLEKSIADSPVSGVVAKAGNKSLLLSMPKSYFTQCFFEREADWKMSRSLLSTLGEQLFGSGDVVNKESHVKVSMDFDFKRYPIWEGVEERSLDYFSVVDVEPYTDKKGKEFQNLVEKKNVTLERKTGNHIYFETKPVKDYAEYETLRAALQEFSSTYVLKTTEDVKVFRHLVELADKGQLRTFRRRQATSQRKSSKKKDITKEENLYNSAAKDIRKLILLGQHGWTIDPKFEKDGWKVFGKLMDDVNRMLYPKTLEEEERTGKSEKLASLTQRGTMSFNQDFKRFRQAVLDYPKKHGFQMDAEFEICENAFWDLENCKTPRPWLGVLSKNPEYVQQILLRINEFELKQTKLLGWNIAVKSSFIFDEPPKLPLTDPYRLKRFNKLNDEWFSGKLILAKFLSES